LSSGEAIAYKSWNHQRNSTTLLTLVAKRRKKVNNINTISTHSAKLIFNYLAESTFHWVPSAIILIVRVQKGELKQYIILVVL